MLRVECPSCGARLKGPDEAAGKKVKCLKCGGTVTFPEIEPSDDWDGPPEGAYDLEGGAPAPLPPRADVGWRGDPEFSEPRPKKAKAKKKKRQSSPEDDDLSGLDTVLCLLCPGIACIASIVYLIQGKGKGLKVLGFSILGSIIWNVVRYFILSSMDQPVVP